MLFKEDIVEKTEGVFGSQTESLGPLSPCWGNNLPATTCGRGASTTPTWRPWEGDAGAGGSSRKKKSAAAEARSQQRLIKFHEKLEPQLGPSRLQLQLRSCASATPSAPKQLPRRTNLLSRLPMSSHAEPCTPHRGSISSSLKPDAQAAIVGGLSSSLSVVGGGGWGKAYGYGVGSLSASAHSNSSSLRQLLTTSPARVSFPTPPPPPDWLSRWSGEWWMVPAGMMTCCASCRAWGPLTP